MKRSSQILIFSFFIKLVLAISIPVLPDEAYYWVWGFHLDWSFFDHPVMVALFGYLGEAVRSFVPNLGPGAIRIPTAMAGHLALYLWLKFFEQASRFFGEAKATDTEISIWLVLMLAHPFFGIGSFLLTPDIPLVLFWVLSLLAFIRALEKPTGINYALLGAGLGLGFISKYHIVLLVPILLFAAFRLRRWIAWRYTPITIISGLLFSSPVFIWNYQHDWMSFRFQMKHGLGAPAWDPWWTWSYVVGQIVLLFPFFAPVLFRAARQSKAVLIKSQPILIWCFFFFTSFKAAVEANWPILAFPAAFWLIARNLKSAVSFIGYVVFWSCAIVLIVLQLTSYRTDLINIKIREVRDIEVFSSIAAEYSPLFAGSYQIAGSLSLHFLKPIYKVQGMNRFDFFDTVPQSTPEVFPIYIARTEDQVPPEWMAKELYKITIERTWNNYQILRVDKKSENSQ